MSQRGVNSRGTADPPPPKLTAVTGPWSDSDLNEIASGASFKAGRIDGYAAHGTCTACHVSLSESFPSDGGPDCAYTCASGLESATTTYKVWRVSSVSF